MESNPGPRLRIRLLLSVVSAGVALAPGDGGAAAGTDRARSLGVREARASAAPRMLRDRGSVRFEPNLGQWDPAVRFLGRSPGCLVFLADGEAVFRLGGPGRLEGLRGRLPGPPDALRPEPGGDLRMRFVDASPAPRIEPAGLRPSVSNYFVGSDRSRWRTGVPHFGEAAYRGLWPGVDLVFRGDPARLEYDVVLAPGADLGAARFRFEGASSIALDDGGDLVIATAKGRVRQSAPRLWQEGAGGIRSEVAGGFRVLGDGTIGFEAGGYDRTRTLVVDPTVSYSTYLGGTGNDWPNDVVLDSTGKIVTVGVTTSADFPRQSAYQTTYVGSTNDAFVTKYAADGQSLVFSTYFGGFGFDDCYGVAVDPSDNVVFCGLTSSTDLPMVSAYQGSNAGGYDDIYIVSMAAAGTSLNFSTYFGTTSQDEAYDVACNSTGIYVAGATNSALFPTKTPVQPGYGGGAADAVILKFNLAGTSLAYATTYGGGGQDVALGIAVDSGGGMYVAGETSSTDFPVQSAAQSAFGGSGANPFPGDGFCLKLTGGGSTVAYATYLGGASDDWCEQLAVNAQGEACLAGYTSSFGFPTKNPIQPNFAGGTRDAWCAKLSAQGSTLVFSTFWGGTGEEYTRGVGVDSSGDVYFCGLTSSADFPLQNAFQATFKGGTPINNDGFAVRLSPTGSAALYSTYYGSAGADDAQTMAVDAGGNAVIVGLTDSNAFPLVNPLQSSNAGGSYDAYVLRISLVPPTAPAGLTAALQPSGSIQLGWTDTSGSEDGFQVERKVGAGAFSQIAFLPLNSTVYLDPSITPSTTYTYRVRAENLDGSSAYSNEAGLTTDALIPAPTSPNALTATPVNISRIDLAWNDRSNNESLFEVERRRIPGSFLPMASLAANTTAWTDSAIGPDTTARYRVRAVGVTSPSAFSQEALASTPPTFTLAMTKGSLTDSPVAGKDKVKAKGAYTILPASPDQAVNPQAEGLTLYMGAEDNPIVVTVGPADAGWKVKNGKATWKSPKGSVSKYAISLDLVKRTFSFSLSKVTFPAAPANPIRVSLRVGNDAGSQRTAWTTTKAGVFSYKP